MLNFSLIIFVEIISVANFPKTSSVVLGSVVQFKCNASGHPTPIIEWLMDGEEVIHDNINISIADATVMDFMQSSTLTYKISRKDVGGVHTVTCRARCFALHSDSHSMLTVEGI